MGRRRCALDLKMESVKLGQVFTKGTCSKVAQLIFSKVALLAKLNFAYMVKSLTVLIQQCTQGELMITERLTSLPMAVDAFGALRPTDFKFDALGNLSISDAALTTALGQNRRRSWQRSCDIISLTPFPPPPPPHGK
jgi:hypothetical protein